MRGPAWGLLMLAVAVAVLAGAEVSPQDVSRSALKAAFLLNFVRFAEWPVSVAPFAAPFTLCVFGDDRVAQFSGSHRARCKSLTGLTT